MATIEVLPDILIEPLAEPQLPQFPSVGDILDLTADELEQHGWIQDTPERHGARCTVNAIVHVLTRLNLKTVATLDVICQALLDRIASPKSMPPQHTVVSWNDSRSRTKGEVITTIRCAAAANRSTNLPRPKP